MIKTIADVVKRRGKARICFTESLQRERQRWAGEEVLLWDVSPRSLGCSADWIQMDS